MKRFANPKLKAIALACVSVTIFLTPFNESSAEVRCDFLFHSVAHQVSELKAGDLVSYVVRNPWGNDPNYLAAEVGVFEKLSDDKTVAVMSSGINNIERHFVGGLTVVRPGDLIRYTIRNPQGDNPSQLVTEIAIFEKLDPTKRIAITSGGFNNIGLHLTGGIEVINPGDTVRVLSLKFDGETPLGYQWDTGVFEKSELSDKSAVISGRRVKLAFVREMQVLR